ncbi:hypothetical protein EWE75_03730 [Sphingomonas populi]|uniref:Uncharacterized protein n=1 Tax=Sphingomonas populi TaxID=2484750 RepID=A0A4Q6Y8B7_9SPHN|nr:hypothetical protein [Sphingomonas populi]RZF65779.1 hypothetical protein EWE75_03730 [Sphingomonas populi]
MIDLRDTIANIKTHMTDGSARAMTYAALECRLAIERICYDRLARAHDYISHEEIRRWPPRHVIKVLEEDVDPHVASTYTISMARHPPAEGDDLSTLEYVPLGTQQGFDGRLITKLWNGLANTALHVSLPKSSAVQVEHFGDIKAIREKVEQALIEIERIASGTLTSTGIGPEVSFICDCGTRIKRRSELLSAGKVIHCINPHCTESFEVELAEKEITFVLRKVHATCTCRKIHHFPVKPLENMRVGEIRKFLCSCGDEIVFHCRIFYGTSKPGKMESTTG